MLLCGNLRRIHLHLTQIYATTNFLFNLVEQLFKVFFCLGRESKVIVLLM